MVPNLLIFKGPPVDGPKDPWPRVLSLSRRFVGDPALLARDNIKPDYTVISKTRQLPMGADRWPLHICIHGHHPTCIWAGQPSLPGPSPGWATYGIWLGLLQDLKENQAGKPILPAPACTNPVPGPYCVRLYGIEQTQLWLPKVAHGGVTLAQSRTGFDQGHYLDGACVRINSLWACPCPNWSIWASDCLKLFVLMILNFYRVKFQMKNPNKVSSFIQYGFCGIRMCKPLGYIKRKGHKLTFSLLDLHTLACA